MVFQVQIYFCKRQTNTIQFIKSHFGAEWLVLVRILGHLDLNVVSGNGYTNACLVFLQSLQVTAVIVLQIR